MTAGWIKLRIEAQLAGDLWGNWLAMADADMEAAKVWPGLATWLAKGDGTPEARVCAYFAKIWCDPQIEGFRLVEPLQPSAPLPNVSIAERIRREALRWFKAAFRSYEPIPLSDAVTRQWRLDVRAAAFSEFPAAFREHYFAAMLPHGTPAQANTTEANR